MLQTHSRPLALCQRQTNYSPDWQWGTLDKTERLKPLIMLAFDWKATKSFRDKLDHLDIDYSLMDLHELNERRIFFRSPGGPLLENCFLMTTTPDHKETIS